jgi:tetratricopeptide (TPR) repeat protein
MGFLCSETADVNDAQNYFLFAFSANPYNRAAFNALAGYSASGRQVLSANAYLESLRLAVRTNPLDIDSAYNFSRLAESLGLFSAASAGYRYCIQVNNYLNPASSYPAEYYRPLALNSMNTHNYRQSSTVLQQVRGYGVFDVMVEAVSASAAKESGDTKEADSIFNSIKSNAQKILAGQLTATAAQLQDYAWFYSFVEDSNAEALTWATKAYDADHNSVTAQAFLAYALVQNGQSDLAKPMLSKIGTTTQTAAIAQAVIYDINENDSNAVALLKAAIESSPATFEAHKAKQMLKKLGSEYVAPVDSAALETVLANEYGQTYFSEFMPPEKMITVSLKTSGSAFSYGTPLDTQLSILNNSSEPLIISPDSMIKGTIRVDVRLSGDLKERFDSYISKTVRPSYEIKPGSALFIPLKLAEGKLKPIFEGHPQANLNMEVTVYLDPQVAKNGNVKNIFGSEPVKVIIKRRKLELDTLYLQQRFDALKGGKQGQRIKSVQLFAGLLAEQQDLATMAQRYKFLYCEPGLLTSAIAKCMNEDDWVLKVQAIQAVQNLNLDYRLVDGISLQLDNNSWPVRLMAVYTLGEKQGPNFQTVLTWVTSNDTNKLVKGMAAELSTSK